MSGHGVVSKHSPAAAATAAGGAAAADDVGPIQKWKRNEIERGDRERNGETMVTSDISS